MSGGSYTSTLDRTEKDNVSFQEADELGGQSCSKEIVKKKISINFAYML